MIRQAIILAGGLGTRLRSVVSDLPKCMAKVAGKPFLHYVIANLKSQGVTHFVFSIGYKSEPIIDFLHLEFSKEPGYSYQISLETEPLGTGGAVWFATEKMESENVLICNGDTYFRADLEALSQFHLSHQADCTLALKPMKNFDRYGVVVCAEDQRILSFREKQFFAAGLINGGIYVVNLKGWKQLSFPQKFSFEKEYLEAHVSSLRMFGLVQDAYFIDIGIPEDYLRAQTEFREFV